MTLVEDDIRRLVEALEQSDDDAPVIRHDLDHLVDKAFQHGRHLRRRRRSARATRPKPRAPEAQWRSRTLTGPSLTISTMESKS